MGLWLTTVRKLQCFSDPDKIVSPGPSTVDGIEIVRFYVFAPPASPLNRYEVAHLLRNPD
jgi:hypothetical protein